MRDPDDLALTALRYAAGELTPDGAAAFEARLADDQAAREALGEAIRLSAAALGQPAPAPDPLTREAVRDRLQPTFLGRMFPRRPYRGHPLTWAGLGGAVAAGLTVVGVWLGDPPAADDPAPALAATLPAVPAEPVAHVAAYQPVVHVAPMPRLVEPKTIPPSVDTEADRRTVAAETDEGKATDPERGSPGRAAEKANVGNEPGPR